MTHEIENLIQEPEVNQEETPEVFLTLWIFVDSIENQIPWENHENYELRNIIEYELQQLYNTFEAPRPNILRNSIVFNNNILSGSFNNNVEFSFFISFNVIEQRYDISFLEVWRQTVMEQRERDAQEIVTAFEHHLDAMRQIFSANTENSQRFGEFFMDRGALNDDDIFTREMSDNESQELIWLRLLDIQENARQHYMNLLQFLWEYPEDALSPTLRNMIQDQIDAYTRMIMWVGPEYNWGARLFRQKTEQEVQFWIVSGVERCESVEELFEYFRSWYNDMSENYENANTLTQTQSYTLVNHILSRASYVRLQELTAWQTEIPPYGDIAQVYAHFVYYLRGGRELENSNESWTINDDFSTQKELRDVAFANEIIHEYFIQNNVVTRLEQDESIDFTIDDPEVWERSWAEVVQNALETLSQTFVLSREYRDDDWVRQTETSSLSISDNDKIQLINIALGKDHTDFLTMENSSYDSLDVLDKYRISSLARFASRSIWQLESQIFDYNMWYWEDYGVEIHPETNIAMFLLEDFQTFVQPRTITDFWALIGDNFDGNNRLEANNIEILSPWERNLLSIFCDMNGYWGWGEWSDTNISRAWKWAEFAAMIAVTVAATYLTGWLALWAWALIWATRVQALGRSVIQWNAMLQWAVMWWYSVPISRYLHPEWHDNWHERFTDLWSDYTVWILTGLIWWAATARYFRQGSHLRNMSLNAWDITLLWFWTEALRYQQVYNYLHWQETFLWVEENEENTD